jgi:CDP-diacylglycerol--serine O-phosphatidyltransferase
MALFILYGILILLFQEIGLMIVFSAFIAKGITTGAITFWKEAFSEMDEV